MAHKAILIWLTYLCYLFIVSWVLCSEFGANVMTKSFPDILLYLLFGFTSTSFKLLNSFGDAFNTSLTTVYNVHFKMALMVPLFGICYTLKFSLFGQISLAKYDCRIYASVYFHL